MNRFLARAGILLAASVSVGAVAAETAATSEGLEEVVVTAQKRAESEQWLLVFEHDPTVVSGRLEKDGKGVGLVEAMALG